MPCLIITGHPCSGKSTFARVLRDRALQKYSEPPHNIHRVVLIQDEDFYNALSDNPKVACYQDSQAEKKTRAALKSAFDRALSSTSEQPSNRDHQKSTLVIVDSLNYIKGFRYELHCLSKAAKEKHGVVWILNDVERCKEWNRQRRAKADKGNDASSTNYFYSDEQMDELILRYEPPDARNRWDQPLYRVDMRPFDASAVDHKNSSSSSAAHEALQRSVYNMHKLSDAIDQQKDSNFDPKQERPKAKKSVFKKRAIVPKQQEASQTEQSNAVSSSVGIDSGTADNKQDTTPPAGRLTEPESFIKNTKDILSIEARADEILNSFLLNVNPLQEGLSTRQHAATDADVLHNVDTITQLICSSVNTAQNKATTIIGKLPISLQNGETLYLNSSRRIPMTELKRLRRQYIQWIQTHAPEDTTQKGIAESFVAYVEAQR